MFKKYTLFFLVVFSLGCSKDFLNTPPSSSAETSEYIKTLSGIQEILNGSYLLLKQFFYQGPNIIYGDVIADDIKPLPGGMMVSQYSWSQVPSNERSFSTTSGNMNSMWTAGYNILRNIALVLENVDNFKNSSPEQVATIKGQALAIRGLVHFQLVNVFAQPYSFTPAAGHPGIPYVTASDYTQPLLRNTVQEDYTNIINDLTSAASLLDIGGGNTFIMGKEATLALLSRVYLFKKDYENASKTAAFICSQVPIVKENYPDLLFTREDAEAIFQLDPPLTTSDPYVMFPGHYFKGTDLSFYATNDIALLLQQTPADVRRKWVTNNGGNWFITKYPEDLIPGSLFPYSSYYQDIIRSTEMYLTAAESYASLGKEDSARYYLNEIRVRAYGPGAVITTSGQPLLDSIAMERRKELCFEGGRMYDLLRQGKGVNRTDYNNAANSQLPYPSDKAIAPIHLTDVEVANLAQNPGYN